MVKDAIALSVRTGVVVQKKPIRKRNAALKKPNAGVRAIIINAKPASEPSREVPKTGPTEPLSKEDNSSNKLLRERHATDQTEPLSKDDSSSNKLLRDRHATDQTEPRKNAKMPIIVSKFAVSERNKNGRLARPEFALRQMRKVVVVKSNESEKIARNARETNNKTEIEGKLKTDVAINRYNHSAIRTVDTKINDDAIVLRGVRFIIARSRDVFVTSA